MAAVTVNWQGIDRTSPGMRREVVQCTPAATGDTFTSAEITTIVGVNMTINDAGIIATDFYSPTFAANVVTLTLGGAAGTMPCTLEIYGFQ